MAAQLAMFEQGMYNLEGNLEVQLSLRLPQLRRGQRLIGFS